MREFTGNRPGNQRPGAKSESAKDLCDAVIKFMAFTPYRDIVRQIAESQTVFAQENLYGFISAMICVWAGKEDLSQEDAGIIEDCRKICDVMGWRPEI